MKDNIYLELCKALKRGESPLLFTVVDGDLAGSKGLITEKGSLFSSSEAEEMITKARMGSALTVLTADGSRIFRETIEQPPKLVLCGGGHISLPLARLGDMLGFRITVIDEREEFANKGRFPMAKEIVRAPFDEALTGLQAGKNTYYVIITRGHAYDRVCLEHILSREYAYVGMIGSAGKVRIVKEALLQKGFPIETLDTVRAPIGLQIGAETPEEIAVCIAAELIQTKNSRSQSHIFDQAITDALESADGPAAFVTVFQKKGSAPREQGTRMLVFGDGSQIGTVGGGSAEKEARELAVKAIREGRCGLYRCCMTNTDAEKEGLICGGVIEVFIEPII
jgi:xanthine dehydrogenase accessory factor